MMIKDLIDKLKNDGLMMLCGMTVLAYFGFAMYICAYVEAANPDAMNIILGQISTLAGLVVGFYFGSSKGSAEKTKIMADKMDGESSGT